MKCGYKIFYKLHTWIWEILQTNNFWEKLEQQTTSNQIQLHMEEVSKG